MRLVTFGWRLKSRKSLAALAAPVVLLGLAGCASKAEGTRVPPPPTVSVTKAQKKNVPIVAASNGTTRALKEVTIRARVKGFLKEQHFQEGANVKTGQLLFVIDEEPFQVKLGMARAELAEAEANLGKAEQSKAREVAKAQLAIDQAALFLAQTEERRVRALFARNTSSKEDADRREADRKKAEAQVESDQASLDQALADYQTNLLTTKANVEKARSQVRDAEINLGYCRMDAPIDGRIGESLVKPGNLVGANENTELATVRQVDPMGVDLRPSSRYLPVITRLVKNGLVVNLAV
jgi:multidrug efflux pump subunit AcrA (membrane-fusion protein)